MRSRSACEARRWPRPAAVSSPGPAIGLHLRPGQLSPRIRTSTTGEAHTPRVSFDPLAPYGPVIESTVRVVTWNVWGRFGADWAAREAGLESAAAARGSRAPGAVLAARRAAGRGTADFRPLRGGGRPPLLSAAGRALRAVVCLSLEQAAAAGRGTLRATAPSRHRRASCQQAPARPAGHRPPARRPVRARLRRRMRPRPGQEGTWHHRLVELADGLPWIRTLNDQLTAVLGPWREKYQGHPVLELMHGGRWLGHPLHPALSDLPIGLWAGALILDLAGADPAGGPAGGQENGTDPVALFTAAGVVAAVATAATGVADWTVSDGEDRRVGLLPRGAQQAPPRAAGRVAGRPARPGTADRPRARHGRHGRHDGARPSSAGTSCRAGRSWSTGSPAHDRPARWVRVLADEDLPGRRAEGGRGRGPQGAALPARRHRLRDRRRVQPRGAPAEPRARSRACVVTCPLHESQFDLRDGHIVRGPAHHPQPALPTRVRNGWCRGPRLPARHRRART